MVCSISIGSVATLGFSIPLGHAAAVIVLVQVLCGMAPAYIITLGPLTGMRQVVQFRYCFGKYCNAVTSLMAVVVLGGFGVTGAITGAQTLSSVNAGSPSAVSVEVAIAVVMVASLAIGFMGYRVMHAVNRWAWIAVLVSTMVLAVESAGHLRHQSLERNPTLRDYMGLVALCAGNLLTWTNVASDFSCCKYHFFSSVPTHAMLTYVG